jgi:hypothetical protein
MLRAYVPELPPTGPLLDGGGWELFAGLPSVVDPTWLWAVLPFTWALAIFILLVMEYRRRHAPALRRVNLRVVTLNLLHGARFPACGKQAVLEARLA